VISAGFATDLDLYWGDDHDGVWGAVLDIPESQSNSCHQYFFYWELTDGTYGTYPEEGSLAFGSCNTQRGWLTEQVGLNPPAEDKGGCATTSATGSLKALAILAGLFALRRRRYGQVFVAPGVP
jgi:MYXO-CTERM domain-containing protein